MGPGALTGPWGRGDGLPPGQGPQKAPADSGGGGVFHVKHALMIFQPRPSSRTL